MADERSTDIVTHRLEAFTFRRFRVGVVGGEPSATSSRAELTIGTAQGNDLVLADPPYAMTDYDTLAHYLPRVLAEDGLLVFETDARIEPELQGLAVRTSRRYGSTRVTVFEHE